LGEGISKKISSRSFSAENKRIFSLFLLLDRVEYNLGGRCRTELAWKWKRKNVIF
jgi:hypothetical protein